jgi:NAD(P)H-dependent flavin oxidoreductase YrpB (nitropropane dioxygenase family)
MRNVVCDLLRIEYPVLAFSHCRDVVAAVSTSGGFGVLGAVAFDAEQLDIELSWIEEHVGDHAYGVDVLVPTKYVGNEEGGLDHRALSDRIPEEHKRFVADLLDRYGVPPLGDAERRRGGLDENISARGASDLLDVVFAHDVKLIASALGPPPPRMVEEAHSRDIPIAALVGAKTHATRQVAAGVDLIVAQGYEAGGHTGEIATMVLVPEVVDAVRPIPVLAAGGIASGRQMAAAMALGASGVWTGSVWLTSEEAETHPVVKQKYLIATSSDTVRSSATTGKPARQLRTAWTEEWGKPSNPEPLPMPLQPALVNDALRRISRGSLTAGSGAEELITYFVGQVVGSMNEIRPARRVLLDMVEEWVEVTAARYEDLVEDAPLTPSDT